MSEFAGITENIGSVINIESGVVRSAAESERIVDVVHQQKHVVLSEEVDGTFFLFQLKNKIRIYLVHIRLCRGETSLDIN